MTYHKIYGRIPYYYENGGYNLSDKGKIICREKHFGEYIEYICKINIFRKFVNNASDLILNHYFADIFFLRYLRTKNKNHFYILKIDDCVYNSKPIWMYYLRANNRNFLENDFYKSIIDIPSHLLFFPDFTYTHLNYMTLFFLYHCDNNVLKKNRKKLLNEYFRFTHKMGYNRSNDTNIIRKIFYFLLSTSYFKEIINFSISIDSLDADTVIIDSLDISTDRKCKVKIRKSPIHGHGVFATEDIAK